MSDTPNSARLHIEEGESFLETIREIEHDGHTFLLKRPVPVCVSLDDDFWGYESQDFGIIAYGATRDAALRSFSEDFSALYDHLARETNDNLTPDAIRIKQAFSETVESVVEHP